MSDKPLLERLQVKNGRLLAVDDAPDDIDSCLGGMDLRAEVQDADIVLVFASNRDRFDAHLRSLSTRLLLKAILWLAYPKLTSKLAGDLNRDVIREVAPDYGLDTVSQIAIDEDWSALRLKRVKSL